MPKLQNGYTGALPGRQQGGFQPEALPLFMQSWWLNATCNHWTRITLEREGKEEAVWSFQMERRWGIRLLRNPPLCPYMGPVFASGIIPTENKMDALFRQLPRVGYLQFSTLPGLELEGFFSKRGMRAEVRRTFYIDLGREEDVLFKAIQSRRRNYIRSASGQLSVEASTDPDLDLFVHWHRRVFEKKGKTYPYSNRLIRKLFEQGLANGNSPFLLAKKKDGTVAAMLWAPVDRDKAYHLLGAIQPDLKINGAMDLLTWEAIRLAKRSGLKWYDFEGSMDEGIARFFRNFGGIEKSFMIYEQTYSRLWRLKQAWLG